MSCFSAYSRAHSLRGLIDTSTSAPLARSAATFACSLGVRANGSQLKNRHAFCQVVSRPSPTRSRRLASDRPTTANAEEPVRVVGVVRERTRLAYPGDRKSFPFRSGI